MKLKSRHVYEDWVPGKMILVGTVTSWNPSEDFIVYRKYSQDLLNEDAKVAVWNEDQAVLAIGSVELEESEHFGVLKIESLQGKPAKGDRVVFLAITDNLK